MNKHNECNIFKVDGSGILFLNAYLQQTCELKQQQ